MPRTRSLAIAGLCVVLAATACATHSTYQPATAAEVGFLDRTHTRSDHGLEVSVAVPTRAEARELFGFKIGKKRIQPVWVEITNSNPQDYWLLTHTLDPEYFSALEVAWIGRSRYTSSARREMESYLHDRAVPFHVPSGETVSGYVFTNQTLGTRMVNVELVGADGDLAGFEFMVEVPDLETDYKQVDFESLYDELEDLDLDGLRRWLEVQPATVTNQKETRTGDPLNIVAVGAKGAVFQPFVRAGWHVTETMSAASVWKTIKSSVLRRMYRYSPVSALYVWGRQQDIALQKARATVDERNHLRLWLAPVTCDGQLVWLGQISRDIGVRFTTKSPTISTHKIDPDVDETRTYLIQDLIAAQGLAAFAYVKGVGAAPIEAPRGNLTGDPYFTDGLRVVLFVSSDRVPIDQVRFLEWERP